MQGADPVVAAAAMDNLSLLSTVAATATNTTTDMDVRYYLIHISQGHWILVLAAATNPLRFEDTGMWSLLEHLRRGRRPTPEVERTRGCRCTGCAYPNCGGRGQDKLCLKVKRSPNYCYGCSTPHGEGCEFNYHFSPNGQWCPQAAQAQDAVGRMMCQEHARQEGMLVAASLVDALRRSSILEPVLFMMESNPHFTTARYRGIGNGRIFAIDDANRRGDVGNDLQILADSIHRYIGQNDNTRWVQKVTINFEHQPYVLRLRGQRRYPPV